MNSMGYMVPFLTMSSILIDVCFTNLIFIGAMFNSYNYWYLLSYSNQFTLHYSMLLLIIFILIIYCYFSCYIQFSLYNMLKYTYWLVVNNYSINLFYIFITIYSLYLVVNYYALISYSLILSSFFSNYTFFIPIFLDFFLIFSTFFFKGPINSIEVFTGFNFCYSILFINFFSLFFQIQFIIILLIIIGYYNSMTTYWLFTSYLFNYFFLIFFFVSMLADSNSVPYDLPEAESELMAGFITEYSTIYFSLILLTEYANIIALTYLIIFVFCIYPISLLFFLYFVCLIRSTLNSLKFDELMTSAWLVILPIMFSFLLLSLFV